MVKIHNTAWEAQPLGSAASAGRPRLHVTICQHSRRLSLSSLLLSGPGVDQLPMQLSWCGSNWTMANTYSTCYWEGGNILPLFKLKRVPALSSPFNYFQSNRFKLSPLFQYINIEKKTVRSSTSTHLQENILKSISDYFNL